MPIDNDYLVFVVEQLEDVGVITWRKMFGGVGIYVAVDGAPKGKVFFALIASDVLYFKVDQSNRADYESEGMGPFKPFDDKDMQMGYYEVPIDVLENRERLSEWANKAVDVALSAGKAKDKKNKVGK